MRPWEEGGGESPQGIPVTSQRGGGGIPVTSQRRVPPPTRVPPPPPRTVKELLEGMRGGRGARGRSHGDSGGEWAHPETPCAL